jgi:ABC-type glycerol-3-phosphate transport system permease component
LSFSQTGVLTLTPSFILANQLGLRDNHPGLILFYIALPLSRAILITIAIMNMLSYYNDLIFPMLMLVSRQVAGYMLACIPQLIIFAGGMKYYIQGVTSGAIKG